MSSRLAFRIIACGFVILLGRTPLFCAEAPLVPTLRGQPWTIGESPDLGPLIGEKQQPVDFAIWQAADGTWQLQSCIRGTKEPGKTRLFHRWEGAALSDTNWKQKGLAMQADEHVG